MPRWVCVRESSLPGFLKLLLFSELIAIRVVFFFYYIQNLKNTDKPREEMLLNSSKCDFAGVGAAETIDTAEETDLLRVGLKEKGLGVIFCLKNLPSVQETWVWSLGQEDPWEKRMCSNILAWGIPWTEESDGTTVYGVSKSWTWLSD